LPGEYQNLEEEDQAFDLLGISHDFKRDEKLPCSDFGFLEVPHQAKFFPTKYLYRLADIVSSRGVKIYENSEAVRVLSNDPIIVETKQAKITANKLIVASYFPFNNPKATHYKKGMYRSYAFEARLPKGRYAPGLYWDKASPYHYFRVDSLPDHDRLIIGGEDHRDEIKMDRDKNFRALEDYLQKIVSTKYEIVKKWSGPILEPSDGLALIGEYEKDQFVATAFSGNGMTYSMIAGLLLRDQILGHHNPWSEVFDPKRTLTAKALLKKGQDYTEEFFGAAVKNLFR
jgi:glycine/D-amino acid oxidase-like deaminating enzyme